MEKRGFTIIELLIVMAVIAILVGIAVPSFRAIQNEAWKSKATGDVKVIKISLEAYYMKHSSFPADSPVGNYQSVLISESPPLIEANLYDPFGASATTMYSYDLSASGKYYIAYSVGVGGNGSATISDQGIISIAAGTPIYASNGHI